MAELLKEYDKSIEEIVEKIYNIDKTSSDWIKCVTYGKQLILKAEEIKKKNLIYTHSSVLKKDEILNIDSYFRQKKVIDESIDENEYKNIIFNFIDSFNSLMNRTITLTFVTEKGDIFLISQEAERQYFNNIDGLKFNFSKDFLSNKDNAQKLKDHQNLKDIYLTTMERYEETNKSYPDGNKNHHFIYWKEKGVRKYAFVQSKGSVNEAYVDAYFNWKKISRISEPNIRKFYKQYIIKVDSMAAIVKGDILNKEGEQYAVKSKGASFESINQYVNMAQIIIDLYEGKIEGKTDKAKKNTMKNKIKSFLNAPIFINKLKEETEQTIIDNINKYGNGSVLFTPSKP